MAKQAGNNNNINSIDDTYEDDDLFDFESDEKYEALKLAMAETVKNNCLEVAIRKVVPIDVLAIFEMKQAELTIDRNAELRNEVLSFIEIAFDHRRCEKMYINFPKQNLVKLRRLLKPFNDAHASMVQRSAIMEIQSLEPRLSAVLKPLFIEEAIFYEQLSEILKGCLMGKTLSDTEKHLFSAEKPFTSSSSSQEEEAKDSVNDLGASSSNQDQFSSALSATSTSMLSDDYEE